MRRLLLVLLLVHWLPATAQAQGTIGPCIDCAVKFVCLNCGRAAQCCTGTICEELEEEHGWTILDYNMVWCQIYTPNTADEDCRGERRTATPPGGGTSGDILKQDCDGDTNSNCESPIVVDLDCGGFTFTDAGSGVHFDIDGDGTREAIAWLDPAGGDALLVLDRNGNGLIDGGRELFGTWTVQPETSEPNGFKALAVFDSVDEGGNGDGVISGQDRIYDELRLWQDGNHDGVSQSDEMSSLATNSVRGLELSYVESDRRDRHGNYLRWTGMVYFETGRRMAAVDVIFRASE